MCGLCHCPQEKAVASFLPVASWSHGPYVENIALDLPLPCSGLSAVSLSRGSRSCHWVLEASKGHLCMSVTSLSVEHFILKHIIISS